MPIAGMNCKFMWWKISQGVDDIAGGSITTGTPMGLFNARMQANPDEQVLLQQGFEVEHTYTITVVPGFLAIHEKDEIEYVFPKDHPYSGVRFRVRGVRYADFNPRDPRNYMLLTVSHSERSHTVA